MTPTQVPREMKHYDSFIATDQWVREMLRKGLKKKSKEFYFVKSVNKLNDGRYLIELEEEFKI